MSLSEAEELPPPVATFCTEALAVVAAGLAGSFEDDSGDGLGLGGGAVVVSGDGVAVDVVGAGGGRELDDGES